MAVTSLIGTSARRSDDVALLDGSARFVADVDRAGQLWARVVRSPAASATIRRLGVDAPGRHPGVVAVLTADDVPDVRIPIRLPFGSTPESELALQPVLARDRVRYVGEPVALVVAADPFAAEDAAELVELDLDVLPPALSVVGAEGAVAIHASLPDNVVSRFPLVCGDVDALFAAADVIVRDTLSVHRHTGSPLETRGLVAEWDARTERLTVWGAAKVKHFNRRVLAEMLGLAPEQVRLIEISVGGGFGVRGEFYPEDLLIPYAALRLGRPVKWIEDRREHFVATNHARVQRHEFEVAARADGTLLAFRDRAWCDQGAFVRTHGIMPALLPALALPGPYAWAGFAIDAHAVLTNRTPVGTCRAPGNTEATFVRERMLDRVAAALGIDPVDLRRRNLIAPERMPWSFDLGPGAEPLVYHAGDFPAAFEALLDAAGYDALRAGRADAEGVGVAAFCEVTGVGPSERARITCDREGFAVHVGVGSVGQGLATVLGQIAADGLGVEPGRVTVHHHDTDDTPEGFGTFASRSTVMAGNAVALAARDLRAHAAEALGLPGDVDLERHHDALAAAGVTGEGTFEKEQPSYSFGADLAVVALDAALGRVRVERHLVAADVGRAVNPALVHGQLAGGVVQGIGGALFEELGYDAAGLPRATSFAEYLLPTAADVPDVETVIVEHPAPSGPLGIYGVGETGVSGAPAAVANAVSDALGVPAEPVALPLGTARVRAIARRRSSGAGTADGPSAPRA